MRTQNLEHQMIRCLDDGARNLLALVAHTPVVDLRLDSEQSNELRGNVIMWKHLKE